MLTPNAAATFKQKAQEQIVFLLEGATWRDVAH